MKVPVTFVTCIFLSAYAAAKSNAQQERNCEITKGVTLSFYGRSDTAGLVAYPECGRINAGGRGTYESPLTMASAPGAFGKCEVMFVPYLLKYVRFEDVCTDCVKDWAKGKLHMQIWTGNEMFGGAEQSDCERDLAPTHGMAVIRNPGNDYRLDTTALYSKGAPSPCRMDHRYSMLKNELFCYGRRDKTAGKQRKKPVAAEQEVLVGEEATTTSDKKSVDLKSANSKSADLKSADLKSADLKSADSKSADLKSADSKSTVQKTTDPKSIDKKVADSESVDKKIADSKVTDKKVADSKPTDKKSANSKSTDNKTANSKNTDKKSADLRKSTDTKRPDLKSADQEIDEIEITPEVRREAGPRRKHMIIL